MVDVWSYKKDIIRNKIIYNNVKVMFIEDKICMHMVWAPMRGVNGMKKNCNKRGRIRLKKT